MPLKPITPTPAAWDEFVRAQPNAHLLQLSAWGGLKSAFGWAAERVALADGSGKIRAGAQVLYKAFPGKLFYLAYVPMGGYVSDDSEWPVLWSAVRAAALRRRATFIKWEPGLFLGDDQPPQPEAMGFRLSPQTVQPPRTVAIDIRDDEQVILARMNQGTRRKIRQSQKAGIRYVEASAADAVRFAALMQQTGERNGFGVHGANYYRMAHALFTPRDAALVLAEHEGDLLAGVFVASVDGGEGRQAYYLYGASSDLKRDLMASYGVQWAAIQWARARGCAWYDLWGIPDEEEATLEEQFQARDDGLWGVYGFKRGWGGQVVRGLGAWDKPIITPFYALYRWMLSRQK
ncbi:MAG: peptidoglycan bridge formation glycyltransferase FemA/FemB family protein [Anaerolineae bacterium]|jgi:lipid II:glycine glycyltransferase (peptidoglycan interpeptide bridge formation enzyme)|nr:peptidoglycan bridge formation glycyltransferase FemA/FemB family protein [Anaerolineae bacterium]